MISVKNERRLTTWQPVKARPSPDNSYLQTPSGLNGIIVSFCGQLYTKLESPGKKEP